MTDTLKGRTVQSGPAPYSMNHKTEVYTMYMKRVKSVKLSDIDAVLKVKGHYEASVRGKRVVLFQKEV